MKFSRSLAALIVLFLIALVPLAADTGIDLVETKDGSIYRGIIVETRPNDGVLIEIAGGTILKIAYDTIVSIRKELAPAAPAVAPAPQAAPQAQAAAIPQALPGTDPVLAEARAAFAASKNAKPAAAVDQDIKLNQVLAIMNQLEVMPAMEIKKFPSERLNGLNLSDIERLGIYDSLKKTDAGNTLALNILMPFGVGSFMQGDNDAGWYQLISMSAFALAWAATVSSYSYDGYYNSTDYSIKTGICAAAFLNAVASYVVGIISPFTYQDMYNKNLKTILN